jgi:hypothetical protein
MTEAERERSSIVAYMRKQRDLFRLIADELPDAELQAALMFVNSSATLDFIANDILAMTHHATLAETSPHLN